VFYLSYMSSELRRRGGRTLLTALGLGVGVGLVVAVTALSDGLDRAQDEILQPLTGLGTDMSVTRPLDLDGNGGGGGAAGLNLSKRERDQLEEENRRLDLDISELGEPGESFRRTEFLTTTQLSFPANEVGEIGQLDGVQEAAGSLTLSATTISGEVPESTTGGFGDARQDLNFDSVTVTGVDVTKASLAPVGPDQVTEGRYLGRGDRRQAVLNVSYARCRCSACSRAASSSAAPCAPPRRLRSPARPRPRPSGRRCRPRPQDAGGAPASGRYGRFHDDVV
jgi:hypothetical protein